MFHEFRAPIPVHTCHGMGCAIYVQSGGIFENDIWCVALTDGGIVRHYTSDQIKIQYNATFGIKPHEG